MFSKIKASAKVVVFALFVGVLGGCDQTTKNDKPNILFVSVDDLRPELGCYGKDQIQSPHLDQLAREGTIFTRAYCQQAVCSPSRISVMTGLRPDSTYIYDNRTHHRERQPDVVTLTQHFIRHGYHAVDFGKIFHGHMGKFNDGLSWSEPWYYPPQNYTDNLRGYLSKENRNILKQKGSPGHPWFHGSAFEAEDVPDASYPDGMTAEAALEALPRLKKMSDKGKPFFLALGIEKPHLPFLAPKKYWDLYDPREIQLSAVDTFPKGAPDMAGTHPVREIKWYHGVPADGNFSVEEAQNLIHGYYACVSYIDALVGKVLNKIRELDLEENTIVILWSDHGWKLSDYGAWSKGTNYEIDARVPLILKVPGSNNQSASSPALVELVDIYPTLCELVGIPLPPHLQGKSFASLVENPSAAGFDYAFTQFPRGEITRSGIPEMMGYSMRTSHYRYTRWINFKTGEILGEELYDHRNDPQETINLAASPETQEIVSIQSAIFDQRFRESLIAGL